MQESKKGKKRKAALLIMRVSENILNHRIAIGLTQEQLEGKTALPISRYESGKKDMTLTTLDIISKALGVTICQLVE